MGLFSRKKKEVIVEKEKEEKYSNETFSGWRVEMPKNIGIPQVYNNIPTGMIPFGFTGSDMLYPQIIEQSIYEAANAHKSCITLAVESTIGAGYIIEDYNKKSVEDKLAVTLFEEINELDKLIIQITNDYRLHNRINILITKCNKGKLTFKRISPAKVAYNFHKTIYYVSSDFYRGSVIKEYKKYENGCEPGEYILDFDGISDKYEPYPVPNWISAIKQIKLGSLIPSFHEANMENSVNPGLLIFKPTEFKDNVDKMKWYSDLRSAKGVDKTGNVMVFSAKAKELLPVVEQLEVSKNDDMFMNLRDSTIDDICMAHNINSILIGVRTAGSLGANQEAVIFYDLFYKTVVVHMKNHIEKTINKLFRMSNINAKLILNENKLWSSSDTKEDNFNITINKNK